MRKLKAQSTEQFVSSSRESSTSDRHKLFYNFQISVAISQETNQYAFKKKNIHLMKRDGKMQARQNKRVSQKYPGIFFTHAQEIFLMREIESAAIKLNCYI